MVAALSFTACGSDDDDNGGSGGGNTNKTITIDGESYYCGELCTVEQTKGNGMYLQVTAVEDKMFQYKGHELMVHISPSKVAELKVGQTFDSNNISVRTFRTLTEMSTSGRWDVVSGSIRITAIRKSEITIQINKLIVKHNPREVEHTIDGTATLTNSLHYENGDVVPFDEE